jgi:hypothetical protein
VHAEVIAARAQGHDHFFESSVPCPFADAVDGAFHLARAVLHAGERIGHRKAQIVMAMDADGSALNVGHSLADRPDQAAVLLGHGVAGGVRNVDYRSSGIDRGFDHFEEVTGIGAAGILGVELDVVGILAGKFDGVDRHLENLDPLLG